MQIAANRIVSQEVSFAYQTDVAILGIIKGDLLKDGIFLEVWNYNGNKIVSRRKCKN